MIKIVRLATNMQQLSIFLRFIFKLVLWVLLINPNFRVYSYRNKKSSPKIQNLLYGLISHAWDDLFYDDVCFLEDLHIVYRSHPNLCLFLFFVTSRS